MAIVGIVVLGNTISAAAEIYENNSYVLQLVCYISQSLYLNENSKLSILSIANVF